MKNEVIECPWVTLHMGKPAEYWMNVAKEKANDPCYRNVTPGYAHEVKNG